MIVELLGTGTSHGVPRIGCDCPVCTSDDPRNKRMRCSAWIRDGDLSIVIDTGPEFRLQAIRSNIKHLDAVLYTHDHADHLNGIDDLRVYTEQRSLPVYGPDEVLQDISRRFPYAVGENPWRGGLPQLQLHAIDQKGIVIGNMHIIPIPLIHGCRQVFGYRIGTFAYLTDCKSIPQTSVELLEGVTTIVIDALRQAEHPTHMNFDEAMAIAKIIGAEKVYFTHLTHRNDHRQLEQTLPEGFYPAYDGLVIDMIKS
ncbi:MAG: MBL fold metallo-hydrolase [Sphaerochaetaceae bacterium]|nr:MBL fold metallo-hydrolase [Sphaerochaetaceae bacterium]NLO59698.1 MBL fold metallo-hydrolase [Spirochaetales bacterium]MDD2405797.1 MBL fold metallo-hydrolase [Sphaerochaetaceae bacterium]MDD3671498.1 MBL fold metallo-hydrolase [Sphaerochaetaceae bacterium]MDD4258346.1 MBL fold metallo-hydrolase [Sphaerochaetaceae bacterium]